MTGVSGGSSSTPGQLARRHGPAEPSEWERPFPFLKEPFALTHMNGSVFVRRGLGFWVQESEGQA